MSDQSLERTLAELEAESAEVEAEVRRRKAILDKSRKQYQALLQQIGMEHEDVMAIVEEGGFHPDAQRMMREKMAEARRGDNPDGDEAVSEKAPKKKRKKRHIVKM